MTPPGDAETITVVLPYFNRADSLPRAIDSVLSQTHEALRLLLVDDCSSDGSAAVARSRHDSRVLHLSTPWNGGASAARNTGLERASSRLVAFMDSDDRWLPDKLERQLKHLRLAQASGRAVAVLGCGWRYEDGSAGRSLVPFGAARSASSARWSRQRDRNPDAAGRQSLRGLALRRPAAGSRGSGLRPRMSGQSWNRRGLASRCWPWSAAGGRITWRRHEGLPSGYERLLDKHSASRWNR